jgi:hypothetical protein
MHRHLLITLFLLFPAPAMAQTPFATQRLARGQADTTMQFAEVARNNPWVIATQIATRFAGEGEFSSQLLVGSQIVYDVPFAGGSLRGWHLPVAANLGAALEGLSDDDRDEQLGKASSALLSTAQGITFGLHPYRVLSDRENLLWTGFGSMAAKVNSLPAIDTTDSNVELIQGRFSSGVEVQVGDRTAAVPLTLSAAFVANVFSGRDYSRAFGERRTWIPAGEFTAILPLRSGTGIVVESVIADRLRPSWRFGILLTPRGKGSDDDSVADPADQ